MPSNAAPDEPLVQMYYLTMGDITHVLVGPVTHAPSMGLEAGPVQNFIIGDILPASFAASLFHQPTAEQEAKRQ